MVKPQNDRVEAVLPKYPVGVVLIILRLDHRLHKATALDSVVKPQNDRVVTVLPNYPVGVVLVILRLDRRIHKTTALDSVVKPQNDRTMDKQYYVYILASKKNGTLYIGITSDLIRRVWEHKNGIVEGFSRKYGVDKLVFYEVFDDPENAIRREKRLKSYKRKWKIDLIEQNNPTWKDLYHDLI